MMDLGYFEIYNNGNLLFNQYLGVYIHIYSYRLQIESGKLRLQSGKKNLVFLLLILKTIAYPFPLFQPPTAVFPPVN